MDELFAQCEDKITRASALLKSGGASKIGALLPDIDSQVIAIQLALHDAKAAKVGALHLQEYQTQFRELRADVRKLKQSVDKAALLDDVVLDVAEDHKNRDDLMKYAAGVQDKSTKSLKNSLATIEAAKDIGRDTVEKLAAGNERLGQVGNNLEEIDTTLVRATRVIQRIARRMATDKLVGVCTCLLLAAIVVVVIAATRSQHHWF